MDYLEQIKKYENKLEEKLNEKERIISSIENLEAKINELKETQKYEAVYILKPDCTAKNISNIQKELLEEIKQENILKIEHIGIKKLAYEIKGNNEGYFITLYLKMKPEKRPIIEKIFRKNENIIKFILMKISEE